MAADSDDLSPTTPSVAVCIPAHGAADGLARLLDSLRAVEHPAHLLQVIVAVDGPDDQLAATARTSGAHDVVVLPENRGSYAARNAAVDAVDIGVDAVLFTDADAEVDPGWVAAHLATLATTPRSGGRVVFRFSQPPTPAEVVDASRHLDQRHYVDRLGYAATVNLGLRREVLDVVRFDDRLRSGGDFEHGQRAAAAGFPIAWSPDAVVTHPARATAAALLHKVDRVARGAVVLGSGGHDPARRRRDRRPLKDVAADAGFHPGLRWSVEAAALDGACSLAFARHNPAIVVPALRRRLSAATHR